MAYPPAPQYPQQPEPSAPRTRPGSVTAAVWTQFLTAAMLILTAISIFATQSSISDADLGRDPRTTRSWRARGSPVETSLDMITFGFASWPACS